MYKIILLLIATVFIGWAVMSRKPSDNTLPIDKMILTINDRIMLLEKSSNLYNTESWSGCMEITTKDEEKQYSNY